MSILRSGDFGARLDGVRLDIFLPTLAVVDSAIERRVRVPFANDTIWIMTAEDVLILKLVFGRTKDFADIERLLAARASQLDQTYVERWLSELFDAADVRLLRYRKLMPR